MLGSIAFAAISGAAATAPMTALMTALFPRLPAKDRFPLPPAQITQKFERAIGIENQTDHQTHRWMTMASHFSYGAAAGALYPLASKALPGDTTIKGALYGLGVWTASYLGYLPATGLLKKHETRTRARNTLMIAAHLLWGATLGWSYAGFESGESKKAFAKSSR